MPGSAFCSLCILQTGNGRERVKTPLSKNGPESRLSEISIHWDKGGRYEDGDVLDSESPTVSDRFSSAHVAASPPAEDVPPHANLNALAFLPKSTSWV